MLKKNLSNQCKTQMSIITLIYHKTQIICRKRQMILEWSDISDNGMINNSLSMD